MSPSILCDTPLSMPVDGIAWSWRCLAADDLPPLLPFVMAADPSGTEAMAWPKEAVAWLATQPGHRGLVGIQCLAGLTLGLVFFICEERPPELPRLRVSRLRWLELARPHRSLDAVLAILAETARLLECSDVLIERQAATEQTARSALEMRSSAAGYATTPDGWHLTTMPGPPATAAHS
jgi:hypothetical protein